MKSVMALLFAMCLPVLAVAQPSWQEQQSQWNELKSYVLNHGERVVNNYGVFMTLSDVTPSDVTQPRQAEYLSAVGGLNELGQFVVSQFHGVSETWTLKDAKTWKIEQWIFMADLEGQLFKAEHRVIVEGFDGTVYEVTTIPEQVKGLLSAWDQKLAEWRARIGAKSTIPQQ
jgi:hypothetical protein